MQIDLWHVIDLVKIEIELQELQVEKASLDKDAFGQVEHAGAVKALKAIHSKLHDWMQRTTQGLSS